MCNAFKPVKIIVKSPKIVPKKMFHTFGQKLEGRGGGQTESMEQFHTFVSFFIE